MDIQEISDSNVDKKEGEVEQLTDEAQKLELEGDGVTEDGGASELADHHHEEEHSHMPSESWHTALHTPHTLAYT